MQPERMERVDVIVAKDQLTNFLEFAGKNHIFHQIEIVQSNIPQGVTPIDAVDLLAKAGNLRNRSSTLINTLRIGAVPAEQLSVPTNDLDSLEKFVDDQLHIIEQPVRDLEHEEAKVQESKQSNQELARFLSGLESVGVSLESLGEGGFLAGLHGETSEDAVQQLQNELDKLTNGDTIFVITKTVDEVASFIAIFPARFEQQARQLVTATGAKLGPPFTQIPGRPDEAKKSVDEKLRELEEGTKRLEE
jgi:vacuolar-type H+-ATPase subunit I/STV1